MYTIHVVGASHGRRIGEALKSCNQKYNKTLAKLKSELPSLQKTSKRIQGLTLTLTLRTHDSCLDGNVWWKIAVKETCVYIKPLLKPKNATTNHVFKMLFLGENVQKKVKAKITKNEQRRRFQCCQHAFD